MVQRVDISRVVFEDQDTILWNDLKTYGALLFGLLLFLLFMKVFVLFVL